MKNLMMYLNKNIDCTAQETSFVATDYKTLHPEASRDWHEWKTQWTAYYNDPVASARKTLFSLQHTQSSFIKLLCMGEQM